ncbi:MAG TPA: C1 family peptidase [Thermoanaerobaculaceae bacterium]|nr:C1 family peptidase [Thermoanaerobaculaceae bacterium]
MANHPYGMGWVRDLPDHRDLFYSAALPTLRVLPSKIDLRPKCPPVYDQGNIGSCTANAIAGAIQFDRRLAREKPDFVPSRLFIYFNERAMEHTIPLDNGAQLRDGIKSVAKQGCCPEKLWPYNPVPADPNTHLFPPNAPETKTPSAVCYKVAAECQVISYHRVQQSLWQMKGCLAEGFPFVFGFRVYDSLWDATGKPKSIVPLPTGNDQPDGGHAVLAVGYDDSTGRFMIRNSWGKTVQEQGYFEMPYSYLTDANLSADFWTVRAVER